MNNKSTMHFFKTSSTFSEVCYACDIVPLYMEDASIKTLSCTLQRFNPAFLFYFAL